MVGGVAMATQIYMNNDCHSGEIEPEEKAISALIEGSSWATSLKSSSYATGERLHFYK